MGRHPISVRGHVLTTTLNYDLKSKPCVLKCVKCNRYVSLHACDNCGAEGTFKVGNTVIYVVRSVKTVLALGFALTVTV